MIKQIIQLGDPRLNQVSEAIRPDEIPSKEIQDLAKDLLETCLKHKEEAAGLSTVQLGVLKRMYVVKRVDLETIEKGGVDQWEVLINPKIIKQSKETTSEWEGCMSISSDDNRLFGPVERSKVAEIEYLDLNGNKNKLTAKNFFAHLILHEQDHLEGKLFLSYVKNPKNIWKEDDLDKYLKEFKKFPKVAASI